MRKVLRQMGKLAALGFVVILILTACANPSPAAPSPQRSTPGSTLPPTQAASPAAKPAPTGPYGQLTIALSSFAEDKFNPITTGLASVILSAPLMDRMFWMDARGGAPLPGVVEKWEIASDGLSWVFHIHKGIKFHNGDDLTADDVKFSIEQYMRKDAYSPDIRNMVDHVEKTDDYTLQVFTKGKQALLTRAMSLGLPYQSVVLPKKYIETNGWDYFEQHPVGSGPFKFVSHLAGDSAEYEALDHHWQKTAEFKTLKLVLMPEETTRVAALKTGLVDMVDSVGFETAVELGKAGYQTPAIGLAASQVQFHAAYDPRAANMPVGNLKVRQALSLAINRDEIIKTFYNGAALPPFPPYFSGPQAELDNNFWVDYCAKLYRYDPQEAKRLLVDAGYPDGFSIDLFTLEVPTAPNNPKLAEILASYWSKIGVKTKINLIDQGTYTKYKTAPVQTPLVGQATTFGSQSLAPANMNTHFLSTSGSNFLGKAFPEFDQLMASYSQEMDETKANVILGQAIKIAADSYTVDMIARFPLSAAISPSVAIGMSLPLPNSYLPVYAAYVRHAK